MSESNFRENRKVIRDSKFEIEKQFEIRDSRFEIEARFEIRDSKFQIEELGPSQFRISNLESRIFELLPLRRFQIVDQAGDLPGNGLHLLEQSFALVDRDVAQIRRQMELGTHLGG